MEFFMSTDPLSRTYCEPPGLQSLGLANYLVAPSTLSYRQRYSGRNDGVLSGGTFGRWRDIWSRHPVDITTGILSVGRISGVIINIIIVINVIIDLRTLSSSSSCKYHYL
jgi:hypothetical protein